MASTSEDTTQADSLPPKNSASSRQRFKPQLSCTFCRSRKLKCDRTMPCENCVKRNLAPSCTYVHAALIRDKAQVKKTIQPPKDVQSQVRRLEELVISLMNKTNRDGSSSEGLDHVTHDNSLGSSGQPAQGTEDNERGDHAPSSQLKDTALSLGRITIGEDNRANYVGSSHWTAILENIAGLKEQLEISDDSREEKDASPEVPGPDILVGSVKAATRAEIIAALPPKTFADKLIERYYQTADMGSSMIHRPTFTKEYSNFWNDPKSAPIMWIGQLYGIFTLSVFYEVLTKSASSLVGMPLSDPADAIAIYREKTIQCLVLGNYTNPGPYTVETLWLHYISTQFQSSDALFGAWMVFALVIRTAMRLGYHRDASHYPNLPIFKGEMQRRLWATIVHMDLQTSLQVGLPRMIREGMYDTEAPRNLMDEDFSDMTTVLPLPRPDHELTAVGCANVKHKITKVLGLIVDQANWTSPITYEMVMKLDKQLHDAYHTIPESFRVKTASDLLNGSLVQRFRKATLDLTFQKARCILHRRFFFPSKTTGQYPYPYSMKSCIDAAMRILQMQLFMHEECKPGRTLYEHRWRTSSLLSQDFLLAGMLICLHIGQGIINSPTTQEESQSSGIRVRWSQAEMLQALQASCRIWEDKAPFSKEAAKAVKTLKPMLAKVAGGQSQNPAVDVDLGSPSRNWANFETALTTGFDQYTGSTSDKLIASAEPNLSSSWVPVDLPSLNASLGTGSDSRPAFDNNGEIGAFETMDWELWDSHVYNTSLSDTPAELWNFDSNFNNLIDPSLNSTMWDQQLGS